MDFMQKLVGLPYKDGGASPEEGFDCYGLSRWCVKILTGIELPEKPLAWRHYGCLLGKDAEIKRGDLLFFTANFPAEIHMGVAISPSEFISARLYVGQVTCEPISRWRRALLNVGRVTKESAHDLRD